MHVTRPALTRWLLAVLMSTLPFGCATRQQVLEMETEFKARISRMEASLDTEKKRVDELTTQVNAVRVTATEATRIGTEAARIGTPVLASRVSGNLGMLGRRYPGYYALYDHAGLAKLIGRAADDGHFYRGLKLALRARRALFSPAAERSALLQVVRSLL